MAHGLNPVRWFIVSQRVLEAHAFTEMSDAFVEATVLRGDFTIEDFGGNGERIGGKIVTKGPVFRQPTDPSRGWAFRSY